MLRNGIQTATDNNQRLSLVDVPTKASWCKILPDSANTGTVYWGGYNVDADNGAEIPTGGSDLVWPASGPTELQDLMGVCVFFTTSGDKVRFVYGR